jgi:hypothetical protein
MWVLLILCMPLLVVVPASYLFVSTGVREIQFQPSNCAVMGFVQDFLHTFRFLIGVLPQNARVASWCTSDLPF